MSILWGFALIIFIVVIHEAGHALAARAFGVGILRFSIGFGPGITLWRAKNFPIVLSPFLLGGYVSLKSNAAAKEWIKAAHKRKTVPIDSKKAKFLAAKSKMWKEAAKINARAPGIYFEEIAYRKRMIILSAGVAMNLISAAIFLCLLFTFYQGESVSFLNTSFILRNDLTAWHQIPLAAISITTSDFGNILTKICLTIPRVFIQFFETTINLSPRESVGVIGSIGSVAKTAEAGMPSYLFEAYFISVMVAALNILPLGIFDGGQIAAQTIERVFGDGRAVRVMQKGVLWFGIAFLTVLMLQMLCSDAADIIRAIRSVL